MYHCIILLFYPFIIVYSHSESSNLLVNSQCEKCKKWPDLDSDFASPGHMVQKAARPCPDVFGRNCRLRKRTELQNFPRIEQDRRQNRSSASKSLLWHETYTSEAAKRLECYRGFLYADPQPSPLEPPGDLSQLSELHVGMSVLENMTNFVFLEFAICLLRERRSMMHSLP